MPPVAEVKYANVKRLGILGNGIISAICGNSSYVRSTRRRDAERYIPEVLRKKIFNCIQKSQPIESRSYLPQGQEDG